MGIEVGLMSVISSVASGVMQASAAADAAEAQSMSAKMADNQRRYQFESQQQSMKHQSAVKQKDRMLEQSRLAHQEEMSEINAARKREDLEGKAQTAELNAQLTHLQGVSAQQKGQHDIAMYSLQAGNEEAKQRARLASNGVDMDAGSAAELQQSAALVRDIDVDTLKTNALMSAWGYRNEELNQQTQADMLRTAKSSITGDYYGSNLVDTNDYFVEGQYMSNYNPALYDRKRAMMPALINTATSVAGAWYKSGGFGGGGGSGSPTASPIYWHQSWGV